MTDHLQQALDIFKTDFANHVKNKGRILDAGCKDDKNMKFFNDLGYGWVGIDKNVAQNVIKGCIEDLPFDDESFHAVFCSHTLEHSKRPFDALREFRRVLVGGGVLFLATPYHCEQQVFWRDKTHTIVPTEMQLTRMLQMTGFVPVTMKVLKEGEDESAWQVVTLANVI